MKALSREDRLVENEVIFREVNKSIEEFIKEEPTADSSKAVPFYCECSSPNCIERIKLTPREYEELHKDKKQFIILVGHEFPEVEKVLRKKNNYEVVEKHLTPPDPKDIDLALKNINSTLLSS